MNEIFVTADEIAAGRLQDVRQQQAVAALNDDSYVVLHGIVDIAHLDILHERMREDLTRILARPDAPFNFNTGNVQQDPPPFAPFLFDDILRNEIVIGVTEAVLGPGVKNNFYSGNTALPGGTHQPVHPDVAQLWPYLAHPTPAFGIVVNVPIVDISPQNGSTEFWPGTHRDTTYDIHRGSARVSAEKLAEWSAKAPPFQPTIPRGCVILRDIRMWHAGTPNHTDEPRPMIAMIHWASWWNEDGRIRPPRASAAYFEHPRLRFVMDYVDGEVDHTKHGAAYDVQTDGEAEKTT